MVRLSIAPGVILWRERFDRAAQVLLLNDVMARVVDAPFYRPTMPKSGAPFSVEETNFGSLGWVSDRNGYRYAPMHPVTGKAWPEIPPVLLDLWRETTDYPVAPECCLVNLYREGARMGLHQDRDEEADAPVLSVSLGDDALFRIGGETRRGPTQSLTLSSGDVLTFGGPARRAFHGIDKIAPGTSTLVEGRINLTLRRVKKTPGQGG
ncbi:MAG TPA: alpha-ketoglutarate-dependent dioxygenase AlkB [Rhizomicrobium sp.]